MPKSILDAPANISVEGDEGFLVAKWSSPPDEEGQIAQFRVTTILLSGYETKNIIVDTQTTLKSGEREVRVTLPESGERYTVQVVAIDESGVEVSKISSITYRAPNELLEAPTIISVQPGEGSTIVKWSAPPYTDGQITQFKVTAHEIEVDDSVTISLVETKVVDAPLEEVGLTLIEPGMSYRIEVVAIDADGMDVSEVSEAKTYRVPAPNLDAPTIISVMLDEGSTVVTWRSPADPEGRVARFKVTAYEIDSSGSEKTSPVETEVVNVSPRVALLKSLKSEVTYKIRVVAIDSNDNEVSEVSSPKTYYVPIVFTDPDDPDDSPFLLSAPTNIQAVRDNGVASVTWNGPSDPSEQIQGYTVSAQSSTGQNDTEPLIISVVAGIGPSTKSVEVPNLDNNLRYKITVVAIGANGNEISEDSKALFSDPIMSGRIDFLK
jgi:hypothetical protein